MNAQELIRKLKRLGATIDPSRGRGGHRMVVRDGRVTFIPVHGGNRELGSGLVHRILKDLGLRKKDCVRLAP